MLVPLNGLPAGSAFWLVFYLVLGCIAGFGAAIVSYAIASVTGYGMLTLDPAARATDSEPSAASTRGRFGSHVVTGSALGGVYAIGFGGTLMALEWWYVNVLGASAEFGLHVPTIIATLAVALIWVGTYLGFSRVWEERSHCGASAKPISTLVADIGVFLLSLVVLLPITFLILFIALFY